MNTTEEAANVFAAMFPSLPASVIADALGKAGGDVQHALDGLLKATQARVLCKPYTSKPTPTSTSPVLPFPPSMSKHLCSSRWCVFLRTPRQQPMQQQR